MSDSWLVLVHGLHDTAGIFDAVRPRLAAGYAGCLALNLANADGTAGVRDLSQQLARQLATRLPSGASWDLVGFSLGALVGRHCLQLLGRSGGLERFISIAAPHGGTWAAQLLQGPLRRDLRPGSLLLRELAACPWPSHVRATCLWTPFDLIVFPAWHATFRGAARRMVPVWRHRWMREDARVWREVERCLASGPA